MPANLTNKRILIVDDEESVLEVTTLILRSLGPSIQIATSPLVALETISREDFDLIITDLSMPDMTGLELARIVKTTNPRCKLVLLTGTPLVGGASGLFDAIVLKPFSWDSLKETVAGLLLVAKPPAGAGE